MGELEIVPMAPSLSMKFMLGMAFYLSWEDHPIE